MSVLVTGSYRFGGGLTGMRDANERQVGGSLQFWWLQDVDMDPVCVVTDQCPCSHIVLVLDTRGTLSFAIA